MSAPLALVPAPAGSAGSAAAVSGASAATIAAAPAPIVRMPSWAPTTTFADLGFVGWFRARFRDQPIRPDRSRLLVGERGGRFDRLDVWILIVLLLATFGLRLFRLAEPYQMHFDEVYHARTATEFLQSWRYGIDKEIYEWTHPHLAKYAMAGGLVLWGADHVDGESELGVPARAAIIEPRRDDPEAPGDRAGERLHIATGDEIRTFDLRTREHVGTIAAVGSSALAYDQEALQLVVGFDDGRIGTSGVEGLFADAASGAVLDDIADLAVVDHPVRHLLVADGGATIIAASDDQLTAVDSETGEVLFTEGDGRDRRPVGGRHRGDHRGRSGGRRGSGGGRGTPRRDHRRRRRRPRGAPDGGHRRAGRARHPG